MYEIVQMRDLCKYEEYQAYQPQAENKEIKLFSRLSVQYHSRVDSSPVQGLVNIEKVKSRAVPLVT